MALESISYLKERHSEVILICHTSIANQDGMKLSSIEVHTTFLYMASQNPNIKHSTMKYPDLSDWSCHVSNNISRVGG